MSLMLSSAIKMSCFGKTVFDTLISERIPPTIKFDYPRDCTFLLVIAWIGHFDFTKLDWFVLYIWLLARKINFPKNSISVSSVLLGLEVECGNSMPEVPGSNLPWMLIFFFCIFSIIFFTRWPFPLLKTLLNRKKNI